LIVTLAASGDREAIAALLDAERLPSSDLATSGVVLIAARADDRIVGCVGVEPHGEAGIVRSLAVAAEFRGRGIARALVSRAEALASERGARCLYLLTEDAAEFWTKAGYVAVSRAEAPASVRASAEFASLCSASATCLRRLLPAPKQGG
jgi:N-acetylglutamate synthase-like GNAT family acetyltransferase